MSQPAAIQAAPQHAPPQDAARVLAPVAGDMQEVDAVIRARLDSDVTLIRTVGDYIVGAGGKRLRPAVLLLIAGALGTRGPTAHGLAAVIEFIHTATLLHDDVVDESDLRRGRPTANAMFGNAASVLVGDFLYSRAFQMMVEAGSMRVMAILADATNRIAEGEVLQLLNIHDPTVDEERYLRVVERKTATLFEAAARIGAVIAGADPATESRCLRYGASLGTAFQIVDDILDYSGHAEELGKRLGDDLREGKVTLPIIYALRAASAKQRELIEAAIRDGGGDFVQIARVVHETGALDFSRARAEDEASAARAAASSLPESDFRVSLLDLIDLAIRRDR
jgi:octaprenyl-diphosphate synthase